MPIFDQAEFDIRCEWGIHGVRQLALISDVIIIVDVFSFSTSVDITVSRGARIYPFALADERAAAYAESIGAELARKTGGHTQFSLQPQSLVDIPAGTRLVLPSRNGSTLSLGTGSTPTLAGCLRNYKAVAAAALKLERKIAVIPAGERWTDDDSLLPAYEDWLGAGAVISELKGSLSPEARLARAAFLEAGSELSALIRQSVSGKQLIDGRLERSLALTTELNVSACVPKLVDGAYECAID